MKSEVKSRIWKQLFGFLVKLSGAAVLAAVLLAVPMVPASAAAPDIRKVQYEGKGKVDVDFSGKVSYKNVKVRVKDTDGKSYAAKILDRDSDDLEFKILNYKEGKTYRFKIYGIRAKGTSGYKNVLSRVKIPKPAENTVTKARALAIAKAHAQTSLNVKGSVFDVAVKKTLCKGIASWEVEFEGRINGVLYSFEYEISRSSGKILELEYEPEG